MLVILLINTNYILIPGFTSKNSLDSVQKGNNSILLSISINNNTDFSVQAGIHAWSGNGSQSSPYIIKNLIFNNSLSNVPLIQIMNTNSYFILENISVIGGSYGIYFGNVSNAIIRNITIYDSDSELLYLYETENIIIKDSIFFNAGKISFNILIDYSTNILVENNTIFNSDFVGIKFRDSNSSTVIDNTLRNNKNSGIVLGHTQNISISNNIIKDNLGYGISVEGDSEDTNVTNNLIYNNPQSGIFLSAKNTLVSNNTIYNNALYGLVINAPSLNTIISNNNFIDNHHEIPMSPQISEPFTNSSYQNNYFSEFTGPDVNNDGIVDSPYVIYENNNVIDQHPKTTVYLNSKIHILTKPNILPFAGTSPYSGSLNITWGRASDTFNHSVTYSVYYSTDNSTWQILVDNISATFYELDTTKLADNNEYLLKIVCKDNQGSTNAGISFEFFGINNNPSSVNSESNVNSSESTNSKTANYSVIIYSILGPLIISCFFMSKKKRPKKLS